MRLASFVDPQAGYEARFGIVRGDDIVDVVAAANALQRPVPATSVKIALTSGPQTIAALQELAGSAERAKLLRPLAGLKFLPPIPDPSKFFCVGKNNRKHREELAANKMLTEVPNEPTGFIKLNSTMSGDGDEVVKPEDITTLDYEPELCYVVGKRAHGVKKADAMDYICGFTLTNDVSAREIQKREVASGSRFWTAKNMPGFAPVGPFVLTMDEVADTDNLWVTCDVNGKQRLRSNTGDYLYKIADVLEHFSRYVVFEPGDLIAMGAPSGVAVGQPNAAELYLQPGDDMVIAFEGLMSLRTRIVGPR
ncbi:fumarylacetoacetate hydrolase family protein [Bradyrhizobium erythrophlei]|jgi:acylpyruvate hydrolase|uniref:5-carboxymethyl-2-hydroxymuconate isomerase n=1 Tax=Bradyrhizobium erythrophlei TaxID=1437360 RepID=A0A1M5IHE2_9BRAD|nr:fumarylacetoacetate hydrolase family protein [Bradyrhizobium erythrophlei]SHG27732.1 5-carboxymethyl-2-hydroxymuconate isomerase [Bradyrhizobium erythrophlei]